MGRVKRFPAQYRTDIGSILSCPANTALIRMCFNKNDGRPTMWLAQHNKKCPRGTRESQGFCADIQLYDLLRQEVRQQYESFKEKQRLRKEKRKQKRRHPIVPHIANWETLLQLIDE